MAKIAPLRGVTYVEKKVPLGDVVAEPYDKIDEPLRKKYLARHEKNCVRLILGKDDDAVESPDLAKLEAYPRARALMDRWLAAGVLARAKRPAVYVLEQRYELHGSWRTRFGLIARVAVDGDDVKFHERTFAGPKSDRRKLLDATGADFDQVFFLAEDPDARLRATLEKLAKATPLLVAKPSPDREDRLFAIDDDATVRALQDLVASRDVTIADGHHRFEMTRERWLERKKAGNAVDGDRYRTAAVFATSDPGLTILPTHRLVRLPKGMSASDAVKKVGERVAMKKLAGDPLTVARGFTGIARGTVGLFGKGLDAAYSLSLPPNVDLATSLAKFHETIRALPVAWLHGLVLDPVFGEATHDTGDCIGFQRGVVEGIARIDGGEYDLIFCLPPTDVADVVRCGKAGSRMPQKSTDFYPKLLTGLLIDDRRE